MNWNRLIRTAVYVALIVPAVRDNNIHFGAFVLICIGALIAGACVAELVAPGQKP